MEPDLTRSASARTRQADRWPLEQWLEAARFRGNVPPSPVEIELAPLGSALARCDRLDGGRAGRVNRSPCPYPRRLSFRLGRATRVPR